MRRLPQLETQPRQASHPLAVCLINPPTVTAPRTLSYYGAVPPLGLAYVAAATRAAGHRVTVIDATGEDIDRFERRTTGVGTLLWQGLSLAECVRRIPEQCRVVGITNTFLHEWPMLRELLALVKRQRPDCLTVVGGENASALGPHMIDASPDLDVCVIGEGEETFQLLLRAVATGEPLDRVPGLVLRGREGALSSRRNTRLHELARLPRPAWDLFPIRCYLQRSQASGVDRGPSLPVLTSRGCPYRCTFCSSPTMWTTRYVRRDPEDVVSEVADLVAEYGIRNVDVNDLTAMLTKDWMIDLSETIARRGVEVTWQFPSGTRSEAIDGEAARALYRAGCRNFCYAPESGSTRVLRQMKKKVSLPRLRGSLRSAVQAGLKTHVSIIIGTPDETAADLLATWKLVLRLVSDGADTVSVMIFSPYPGSELYESLRGEGLIDIEDERWIYGSLVRSGGAPSYNRRFSGRQLSAIQLAMLSSFFAWQSARRPSRTLAAMRNAVRGRQESVLDQLIQTKVRQLGPALGRGL